MDQVAEIVRIARVGNTSRNISNDVFKFSKGKNTFQKTPICLLVGAERFEPTPFIELEKTRVKELAKKKEERNQFKR